MRYLVTARVKPGRRPALDRPSRMARSGPARSPATSTSHNMDAGPAVPDGTVKWVETCFCATPLDEERPYWEAYFDLRP